MSNQFYSYYSCIKAVIIINVGKNMYSYVIINLNSLYNKLDCSYGHHDTKI